MFERTEKSRFQVARLLRWRSQGRDKMLKSFPLTTFFFFSNPARLDCGRDTKEEKNHDKEQKKWNENGVGELCQRAKLASGR